MLKSFLTVPLPCLLVFEHFGRWGTAAVDFLNSLARRSRDIESHKNDADFNRGFWRKKFSVILQRYNDKLPHLLPQEVDEDIYHRDVQNCLH